MVFKNILIASFVCVSTFLSAQESWLSARTAFVVNKSVIIDNPDDFFFDSEIETSSLIEFTYSWQKNKYIYEAGIGFLEIRSFVDFENNRDLYGFGRGGSGEIYLYYYAPFRVKRRFPVTKWFSLTGGLEGSLMYFSNDNLFLLEGNNTCFSNDGPFLSCRRSDNIERNRLVPGAGINTSFDFTVSRFRLSLFAKRDWRIGQGYQLNITSEIRRASDMEVVESHFGSVRPILHTWNIGIGLSYRL